MQKRLERQALMVSVAANFIFTIAGIWIFAQTKIQALFLDCFFSFIAFLSTVTAVMISRASRRQTTHYPFGLFFLEPLYAIFKSLLTLFLLVFSVTTTGQAAWEYFAHGVGEPMNIGPVLPYTILMVVLCFSLGFFNTAQNRKIHHTSTILTAEAKTNFIDGLMSLGIGVSVVFLKMIDINGSLGFLHYTGDFFITAALVLLSLKEPVMVLLRAFRELSGATTDQAEIEATMTDIVRQSLKGLVDVDACHVFKTGMHLTVQVYLSGVAAYGELQAAREKMLQKIQETYENVEIVYCL